jgi:hypothetical protein
LRRYYLCNLHNISSSAIGVVQLKIGYLFQQKTFAMTTSEVSESAYGRLINISARQRMLSQRIGFLFLTINTSLRNGAAAPDDLLDLLKTALSDFVEGYDVLRKGKPEDDLPFLNSARIRAILEGNGRTHGQDVIERFLSEVSEGVNGFARGEPMDEEKSAWFSGFVLRDLLAVLQSIVAAIETDFDEEMERRQKRRSEDVAKVMAALQEIQRASKFSRMIALNAKISANRAGPYGQEFGALTEQIKQISSDITESSEDILKHLEVV